MLRRLLLPFAVIALGLHAAAFAQPAANDDTELYDMLLGEIAQQRGDYALAAKTYLDLARRTRDARVARRAVEVANQGRLNDLALDAAKTWYEIEPQSAAALSVVASLLVSARKVDEAEPYLAKLLNTEGVDQERGYLQINRLLAGNPDKRSNLRVVQKLAARHPELAPAHFAIAQAAALADDEQMALSEARRAAEMRPEWEAPAMLEAQIVQKRSTAQAAKRLADFVAKNPQSRGGRLAYARALVADKRAPEARKQFEAVLTANPGDTELVYTVGLLALQLKDYAVAEENMKRLVSAPDYRDPDGARFILGQIAEEQKQWPRAVEWYEQIQDGEHALPARLRTANAIAKEGKLQAAREYLHKTAADHPGQEVQFTVAEAQLLRRQPEQGSLRSPRQRVEGGARAARAPLRLRAHRREAR